MRLRDRYVLGKSHLAIALARRACEQRYAVLFASAVDVINTLTAAQAIGRLKQGLADRPTPSGQTPAELRTDRHLVDHNPEA